MPPRPFPRKSGSAGEFETLIAEISGRFVTLPPEEIDEAVTAAPEPIGRFMGGDRCFIFLLSEDGTHHRVAHVWTAKRIPDDPVVVGVVVQKGFPWWAVQNRRARSPRLSFRCR